MKKGAWRLESMAQHERTRVQVDHLIIFILISPVQPRSLECLEVDRCEGWQCGKQSLKRMERCINIRRGGVLEVERGRIWQCGKRKKRMEL